MVFSLFLKASKIFRSILEMLGNLRVIRKSQFVSSLTADHYFWCSGGVPCCFEGVLGYYGMFQGCSGVVPGRSELLRGFLGMFRGVPECSRCSGFYRHPSFCLFFRVSVKPGTLRNTPEHPGISPEHPGTSPEHPWNTPEQPGTTSEHPWNIA